MVKLATNDEVNYIVERTETFKIWFKKLKNIQAKSAILSRIIRIEEDGFFGDNCGVGDNISELRFHVGAGYRVYYTIHGNTVVLLLCGGDKDTQQKDIEKAKAIRDEINWSDFDEN